MAKSSMPSAKGKPGMSSVDEASRGSNPAGNSGGTPGRSMPQKPIPGPSSPGMPIAMKKALAKKPPSDGGRGTGGQTPGLVR